MSSLKNTFIINEAAMEVPSVQKKMQRAKSMMERSFQDAMAKASKGDRAGATTAINYLASELDVLLSQLAQEVGQ